MHLKLSDLGTYLKSVISYGLYMLPIEVSFVNLDDDERSYLRFNTMRSLN